MYHITVYRGPDGSPSWATIHGVDPVEEKELYDSLSEGLGALVRGETFVLATIGDDINVEVV